MHRSYVIQPDVKQLQKPYDCIELKQSSNERLEFLGDGILESITKLYLYKRFLTLFFLIFLGGLHPLKDFFSLIFIMVLWFTI